MRPAQAALFRKRKKRRHKKAFDLPQGRRRRQDGVRHRRDSTPILSVARQSPGPHGPGLDERKKAGLLTSGSSYSLRLTARLRAVASWNFRRPLQRRYRTGFTPVSLFSPAFLRGTFLRVGPCRSRHGCFQRTGCVNRRLRREGQAVYVRKMVARATCCPGAREDISSAQEVIENATVTSCGLRPPGQRVVRATHASIETEILYGANCRALTMRNL